MKFSDKIDNERLSVPSIAGSESILIVILTLHQKVSLKEKRTSRQADLPLGAIQGDVSILIFENIAENFN